MKGLVFEEALDLKRMSDAVAVVSTTEAELKRFVGKYEAVSSLLDVDIEMVNSALRMSVGGDRPVPRAVKPTRFKLISPRNKTDSFLEFDIANDAVLGVTLEQGGVKTKLLRKR